MRLTELSLEKYGCFLKRSFRFPEEVGLSVVYGPNEAGKSTCLKAIGQYFFGIPKDSKLGTFGNDVMRIGASMRLADGRELTYFRRKGYKKTLLDMDNASFDDDVLAPVLGPVTEARFKTLFGLDHESLRTGGDQLLLSEGAIGRLIIEAGGGLKALVGRLEKVDADADGLFGKTAKQTRAFYKGKKSYDDAVDAVRKHQVSRDLYEEMAKRFDEAARAVSALRKERQDLVVETGRLDRVQRVAPRLRERNDLIDACRQFADTEAYPDGFFRKVRDALTLRGEAKGAHEKALEQCEKLKARAKSFDVSVELSNMEELIRSLNERATIVAKARGDRHNREREIDTDEGKLDALRRKLGAAPDADLAGLLPAPEAIDLVQTLATEATKRKPTLDGAEERAADLVEKLKQLDLRIAQAMEKGHDRPFEVAAAHFAALPARKATLEKRESGARETLKTILDEAKALGVGSVEELAGLCCPTPDQVREEIAARAGFNDKRIDRERLKREALEEVDRAFEELAAVEADGAVATDETVAESRAVRNDRWLPIRDAYVEGRVEGVREDREGAAVAFESQVGETDSLSDRRTTEAGRAFKVQDCSRRMTEGRRKAAIADREIAAMAAEVVQKEAAFATAYPEILKLRPSLEAILDLSTKRESILERNAKAHENLEAIGVEAAEIAPALELFERIERKLQLEAASPFVARALAVQTAIAGHEAHCANLTRDVRERGETAVSLREAVKRVDQLRAEQEAWEKFWPDAMKALGLPEKMAPAEANRVATEWAGASGVIGAIERTRGRLRRMDDDEKELAADVAEAARVLGIEVGTDAVAAAQMLKKRWDDNETLRARLEGLKPDLEEARVATKLSEDTLKEADEALVRLAAAIGAVPDALEHGAARHEARCDLEERIRAAERAAVESGDGLSVEALNDEWAGRDVDLVRASLADLRKRQEAIDVEWKAAILAEKEAKDTLDRFATESEVNRAVTQREGAMADMQGVVERYLELSLASFAVKEAMARVRAEQQNPLFLRAGALFQSMTEGEFVGIDTGVGQDDMPFVVGVRANGGRAITREMSDGTRDQLFLAFRLASLEKYGDESGEPLPFVADDILVHFDDTRAKATMRLLAEFGERNQILLFTHHESVRDAAAELGRQGLANVVTLERSAA